MTCMWLLVCNMTDLDSILKGDVGVKLFQFQHAKEQFEFVCGYQALNTQTHETCELPDLREGGRGREGGR